MRIRTAAVGPIVLGVAVVAVAGSVGPLQSAHAAGAVRYASPDGSGTVCSHKAPCGIVEAVDQAPANSEVVVNPGHYGTAAAPLTTEITDASTGQLRIHGDAGKPLPVIHSSADYAIQLLNSHVSFLKVVATGTSGGVLGTYGDHLDIEATAGAACTFNVMLSESLCIGSGDTTDGIRYSIPGSQVIAINNVTAIAEGAHAEAFSVSETGANLARVNVSSSIFAGATYDVGVFAAEGGQAELNVSHSRYKTRAPVAIHSGITSVNDIGGNITDLPVFEDPSHGAFEERQASKTVDAGTADPDFTTDLVNEPRSLGHGPDMGAYEFLPAPGLTKVKVAKPAAHTIMATVTLKPNGLPTTVRLVAVHHSHTTSSHLVSVGAATATRTVTVAVHGLDRKTSYNIHASVRSDGGKINSAKQKIQTA